MKILSYVLKVLLFVICFGFFLYSCNDDETITPKPKGFFRIALPDKKFVKYDSSCPFKFEIPVYSKIEKDKNFGAEPCWLNLNFFGFNGILHLSYKEVNGDINDILNNTYQLAAKHQIKASGIETQVISKPKSNVYGLIYDIEGNAASAFQFFLTDSVKHYIRGALYFNAVPNMDSIAPVLDFVRKDIYHVIETFEWKNDVSSNTFAKAMHKK